MIGGRAKSSHKQRGKEKYSRVSEFRNHISHFHSRLEGDDRAEDDEDTDGFVHSEISETLEGSRCLLRGDLTLTLTSKIPKTPEVETKALLKLKQPFVEADQSWGTNVHYFNIEHDVPLLIKALRGVHNHFSSQNTIILHDLA